jgi:Fe-S-cluster containining protein
MNYNPIAGTIRVGNHDLPGIWQYLLPEEFMWLKLPNERFAVCGECHRVETHDYRSDCRCCTYFPQIPNFLLGLALKDPDSEKLVKKLIESGNALPEGSQFSPKQFYDTTKEFSDELFGKSTLVTCPFIDSSKPVCGIYPYRGSICATFFCENDHGDEGREYWEKIQALVGQIETSICQWAMDKVGLDAKRYIERMNSLSDKIEELSDPSSGAWSLSIRKFLWGDWFGRECDFYEECADLVIEMRDRLYEIACNQYPLEAFQYEHALKHWIPSAYRDKVPPLPEEQGVPVSISHLWYQLQLATRQLWELPFNEGSVVLSEKVVIKENPQDDTLSKIHGNKPYLMVLLQKEGGPPIRLIFLTDNEKKTLKRFKTAQVIGERLFDTIAIKEKEIAKEFLAECMRKQILVAAD